MVLGSGAYVLPLAWAQAPTRALVCWSGLGLGQWRVRAATCLGTSTHARVGVLEWAWSWAVARTCCHLLGHKHPRARWCAGVGLVLGSGAYVLPLAWAQAPTRALVCWSGLGLGQWCLCFIYSKCQNHAAATAAAAAADAAAACTACVDPPRHSPTRCSHSVSQALSDFIFVYHPAPSRRARCTATR